MKKLYKFEWDCGRQGDIEGVFVAEEEVIKNTIGRHLYFGEVLGKHSEIYGTLDEKDLTVLSEDADFIAKFEKIVGNCGFNPLNYLPEA